LQILVAHLQDALLPITAIAYDRKMKTFAFLANRHCWEHQPHIHEGAHLYHRVHSGICFRHVKAVHHRGFHPKGPLRTLNFLTIQQDISASIPTLHLIFAGINEIRLQVGEIHCHLGDIEHPWPTRKKPIHVHEHVTMYNEQASA
jgi:hypothetical protein